MMDELVKMAKENDVAAIIKTNGYGDDIADRFGELTGLPVIELDPHPGMQKTGMTDYFQQVMGNTNRLLKNFREIGLPEQELQEQPEEPSKEPTAEVQIPDDVKKQLEEQMKKKEKEEGAE